MKKKFITLFLSAVFIICLIAMAACNGNSGVVSSETNSESIINSASLQSDETDESFPEDESGESTDSAYDSVSDESFESDNDSEDADSSEQSDDSEDLPDSEESLEDSGESDESTDSVYDSANDESFESEETSDSEEIESVENSSDESVLGSDESSSEDESEEDIEEYIAVDDNFYYIYLSDTDSYSINAFGDRENYPENIVVPSYYKGKKVTKIGFEEDDLNDIEKRWFSFVILPALDDNHSIGFISCHSLKSIYIPDTITSIFPGALAFCNSLINISVSNENMNYKSIDGVLYSKDSKVLVQYPIGRQDNTYNILESTIEIGSGAFGSCQNIVSIILPEGIKTIGDGAFEMCFCLESINIPSNTTYIGDCAFAYCSLTDINIPESVSQIGYMPFAGCAFLSQISVSQENPCYKSLCGVLYTKSGDVLIQYPAGKADVSFVCPDAVVQIGIGAFTTCVNLTEIVLTDNIQNIGEEAFNGCSGLLSINIPKGLQVISDFMFNECTSLGNIVIPENINEIGLAAFQLCICLTDIRFEGTITQWSSIIKGDGWNWYCPAKSDNYGEMVGLTTVVHCSDGDVTHNQPIYLP